MADEQFSLTSLVLVVVFGGLVIRYLFFGSSTAGAQGSGRGRDAASAARAREAAVERIQQMFPQIDRRTILWELQRNGGNMTAATERILAGRVETPPVTFQPPPPPSSPSPSITGAQSAAKVPFKPTEPDLISRYKLQNKVSTPDESPVAATEKKTKAWSSNRDERQSALQKRRDEMILAARRKMEAKMAAEKAAGSST